MLAPALPAQDLFPLAVGNFWLYQPVRINGIGFLDYRSISVHGTETIAGRDYFQVNYFGREVDLRLEPSDGSIVEYDSASGTERNWLSLGAPVGTVFPTDVSPCGVTTASIASRDTTVKAVAGQFDHAVEVSFRSNCVDVGVIRQVYAPSVGLVIDQEVAFIGSPRYDLAYYRVGSAGGEAPGVSFSTTIDSPRYPLNSLLQARLTLRNAGPVPVLLHFPSGQSFDFRIADEKGEVVWSWSSARLFAMIVRDEELGTSERTYGLSAPLDGLPPGRYTAIGYLTTSPQVYQAEVSFEIVSTLPAIPANNRLVGRIPVGVQRGPGNHEFARLE
jgi:hypothetical protein